MVIINGLCVIVLAGNYKESRTKPTFSNVLNNAAVAFANALSSNHDRNVSSGHPSTTDTAALSNPSDTSNDPSKVLELRMKQLKYIQELYKEGVLTEEEFTEQKGSILSAIRKL